MNPRGGCLIRTMKARKGNGWRRLFAESSILWYFRLHGVVSALIFLHGGIAGL